MEKKVYSFVVILVITFFISAYGMHQYEFQNENSPDTPELNFSAGDVKKCSQLINLMDIITLALPAMEINVQKCLKKTVKQYQPSSKNKKKINKTIDVAVKSFLENHSMIDGELSHFPKAIQDTIKDKEKSLQEILYNIDSIQDVQEALNRVNIFHKEFQYFTKETMLNFFKN